MVLMPAANPKSVKTIISHGVVPKKGVKPEADPETDPQPHDQFENHAPGHMRLGIMLVLVAFRRILVAPFRELRVQRLKAGPSDPRRLRPCQKHPRESSSAV